MGWVFVFLDGLSDVVVVGCSERRDVNVSPNFVAVVGLLRSELLVRSGCDSRYVICCIYVDFR